MGLFNIFHKTSQPSGTLDPLEMAVGTLKDFSDFVRSGWAAQISRGDPWSLTVRKRDRGDAAEFQGQGKRQGVAENLEIADRDYVFTFASSDIDSLKRKWDFLERWAKNKIVTQVEVKGHVDVPVSVDKSLARYVPAVLIDVGAIKRGKDSAEVFSRVAAILGITTYPNAPGANGRDVFAIDIDSASRITEWRRKGAAGPDQASRNKSGSGGLADFSRRLGLQAGAGREPTSEEQAKKIVQGVQWHSVTDSDGVSCCYIFPEKLDSRRIREVEEAAKALGISIFRKQSAYQNEGGRRDVLCVSARDDYEGFTKLMDIVQPDDSGRPAPPRP